MQTSVRPKFDGLIEQGVIKEADLLRAAAEAHEQHIDVETVLMRRYRISKARIGAALEKFYKCRYVPFDPRVPAPTPLLRSLKPSYLRTDHWVPLEARAGRVTVLIDDPNHLIKRDAVRALLPSVQIDYCVGLKEDIEAFIDHFFGRAPATPMPPASDASRPSGPQPPEPPPDAPEEPSVEVLLEDVRELRPEDPEAVELLSGILREALGRGASHLHVEPAQEGEPLEVRVRVDGHCAPLRTVPADLSRVLAGRIKLLAGLDQAERRQPQQGRFVFEDEGRRVLLQVSTVPTRGELEDLVLRVAPAPAPLGLGQLGLSERNLDALRRLLGAPRGLLLVAGPAGAGRTTALRAALQHLLSPARVLAAVEDPGEVLRLPVGVREAALVPGLGCAGAVRALLRADADVILVNELRGGEDCAAALEAALGGRLLLCGVTAPGSIAALARLLELGLDRFQLSDALLGVLGVRLARRLCEACREAYEAEAAEREALVAEYGAEDFAELGAAPDAPLSLYRGKGCGACHQAGCRGRLGLQELLEATDGVRALLRRRAPAAELGAEARREGLRSARQDGIAKALAGLVDLREVRAACA